MSDQIEPRQRLKNWLPIIALLPILGVSLLLLNFVANSDNSNTTSARIGLLFQLLVPFLLGASIVWLGLRKQHAKWALVLGAVSVVTVYLILFLKSQLDIAECRRVNPEFMCGEWDAILWGIWLVMCSVNLLAVIGVAAMPARTQAKRGP